MKKKIDRLEKRSVSFFRRFLTVDTAFILALFFVVDVGIALETSGVATQENAAQISNLETKEIADVCADASGLKLEKIVFNVATLKSASINFNLAILKNASDESNFAKLKNWATESEDDGLNSSASSSDSVATFAEVVEDPKEQKAFRRSVRRQRFPWYSDKDERVVYLPLYVETPSKLLAPRSQNRNVSAFWLRQLYWCVFALLILAILGGVGWALYLAYRNRGPAKEVDEKANRERRLDTLAPEARERLDDLDGATTDAWKSGDFRDAIVYYFSWLLVEMDKRGLILMNKGKTNREYWFELDGKSEFQTIYRATMDVFERVYFGGRSIDRDEFETVWKLRAPFEELLRQKDAQTAAFLAGQRARTFRDRAARATDIRPNGSISRTLLIPLALSAAASSVAISGCRQYWDDEYVKYLPQNHEDRSVDGVAAFADYCKTKTKRVDFDSWYCAVDGEKYETIVWFYDEKQTEIWRPDFDENVLLDEENAAEINDDAFASDKPIDVSAAVENWRETARPPVDGAFFAIQKDVETWLKAKPNRTFVLVPTGWRADVDFWKAVQAIAPLEGRTFVDAKLENAESVRSLTLEMGDEVLFTFKNSLREKLEAREKNRILFLNLPRNRSIWAFAAAIQRFQNGENIAEIALEKLAPLQTWFKTETQIIAETRFEFDVERNDDFFDYFDPDGYDDVFNETAFGLGCSDPNCPVCYPWNAATDERDGVSNAESDGRWFEQRFLAEPKRCERFSGESTWLANLPSTKEYWATRTLEPVAETETLLSVDDEPFVCRRRVGESQFFVLSSSAFLLNYSLLDPTNRVLAARLTNEFNPEGRALIFAGSRFYFAKDENSAFVEPISPFSLSQATPFTVLVWHLIVLATALVCWLFPIFGRPKRAATERTNDFGKHVDAVAFLLERADCRRWARAEIEKFRAARVGGSAFAEPRAESAENDEFASIEPDVLTQKTTENDESAEVGSL